MDYLAIFTRLALHTDKHVIVILIAVSHHPIYTTVELHSGLAYIYLYGFGPRRNHGQFLDLIARARGGATLLKLNKNQGQICQGGARNCNPLLESFFITEHSLWDFVRPPKFFLTRTRIKKRIRCNFKILA